MTINCPNCGHIFELPTPEAKVREEILNSGLVRILIKAVVAVHRKNKNIFHWHHDLNLTNTESHNFQKLRYHGLIAHADKDHPKSGEWIITARGGQFLRGEIAIPRRSKVQNNHVIGNGNEFVHINELKHEYPEFSPIYAYAPCLTPQKAEQPKLFAA